MLDFLYTLATSGAWTMDYSTIISGLQTGMQSIGTAAGDTIEAVAPVAAAVAGGYVVVKVGMKTFRRIVG